MTTTSITPNAENKPLLETLERLQGLIEDFIEVGVLVHDNQGTAQSQAALIQKTNQAVNHLGQLEDSKGTENYPIPIDVLTYIEDGRNPDVYTREFVELTARSNARLKGRMEGFRKLRDVLGIKLVQEFPHLESAVEGINRRTS